MIHPNKTMNRKILKKVVKSTTINAEAGVVCVVFTDGAKQLVRCSPSDEFDPEIGFALALCRKILGSRSQVRRFLAENARLVWPKREPVHDAPARPANKNKSMCEYAWFRDYMEKHKLTLHEVCELTELASSTVSRVRLGYCVNPATQDRIVSALGMTDEEAAAFRASLTKHQPRYEKL